MTTNLDTLRTAVENAGEAWADGEHIDIITPPVVLELIERAEAAELALDHYAQRDRELKTLLSMISDRLDEFCYDELSSLIEDSPLDQWGETYKSRLEQTEQQRDSSREACKTLAEVLSNHSEWIVEATDSQDLIGEDGDGDWDVVWDRVMELGEAKRKAEQAVQRVRELHEEYVIYAWDGEVNFPKLDANGQKVVLARLCRACSSEDGIGAAEDGEWDDGYDDVDYPCPTVHALDGDGRG